ncbi:MAG TPA: HAMP domain-containing sensor histidine kinase [Acidimicrobiales bacterium]|nr:HAMP domain-containing sensor histidine kinase [Acidimicrobiales bacterium]
MRRRLTVTMIAMVAGALIFAGLFTLLLTIRSTRDATRRDLLQQAQQLALGVKAEADQAAKTSTAAQGRPLKQLLTVLKRPLRLEGEAVLAVNADGQVFDIDTPLQPLVLPSGLVQADLRPTLLLAGQTVSGRKGAIVYAAAPYRADVIVGSGARARLVANLTQVVVLTRRTPTGLRQAGWWFLITSALTLVAAAFVADRLGRRITRPLVAAEAVTRRIAAGDLAAQVPVSPNADRETASLAHSINTMTESLARSRGLERQFLMSVSHDLRTPLTSIRGFAEAIAEGAAPDPHRAAEIIASESRRLERLVRDLLDLAKLDARRFSFDLRRVDLGEVVADTGEGFRPAADDLGLTLTVDPGLAGALIVTADPDRLAQVVANLVENALKYANHQVRVAAAVAGGQPMLWVDDDGPGIPPQDLPRVFDRLFMSSRHPARQVGSGLGLAIVAELVQAMGGTVRAESPITAVAGTRMVVTMPTWSELGSSLSAV